jgi:hypothetical protein
MQAKSYSPKSSGDGIPGGSSVPCRKEGAMPESTVTISPAQREAFYQLVLDHLSGVGDLLLALERGDFAAAERLGIEFGEDLRLMEDLGWEDELREADLTMAPEELAEVLKRLKADAEKGLVGSSEEREAKAVDEAARERYEYARVTCEGLLDLLANRGDDSA